MSDEAKVAYLQEKIREARRNQIIGYVAPFVVEAPFFFLSGFLGVPEEIAFIFGGVLFAVGFGLGSYYGSKKNELMEQLKRMAGFTQRVV